VLILAVAGYAAVRFVPGRFRMGAQGRLRTLGALNLGRDMVYIVQTGPEVVALLVGRAGSVVIGRWSAEEWEDYSAASASPKSSEDGCDRGHG
jgi:hypothetical protein